MIAAVLALECVPVTMLRHPWLRARTESAAIIFFFVALLFFGRSRLRAVGWSGLPQPPLDRVFAALHAAALAAFVATDLVLLSRLVPGTTGYSLGIAAWYGLLLLLPVTLAATFFSWATLSAFITTLGTTWTIAALCGLLTMYARNMLMLAWDAPTSPFGQWMQRVTFRGTYAVLSRFYANVVSDPATQVLGTDRFVVRVAGVCSGIEGLALMFGLTVGWLIYSRRELRLGRALLLVPASLLLICTLNVLRIAALIALGDAGHGAVALGGFHSEAGWILFSTVAMGFLVLVNRVGWFRLDGGGALAFPSATATPRNEAAIYLGPLLAVLAMSLLTQAASAGFERLYGLRLLAALAVFFLYREEYRRIDWHFGWLGPAAGVGVFVCWMAWWARLGAHAGDTSGDALADGLAQLTVGGRAVWLTLRALAAVVTVPIAEELAFRGYIARRVMSAEVDRVAYARLSWIALGVSAVLFGAMHGAMWPVGILAGLVFGLVAKLRGRLGEAVAAHATVNLLIALWVLARGEYSLW